MDYYEYNRWNAFMKAAIIGTFVGALTIAGCASLNGMQPETSHKDDRRLLPELVGDYWDGSEIAEDDTQATEGRRHSAFLEGQTDILLRIQRACDTKQEFKIDGRRFGCMPLRIGGGNAENFSTR